MLLSLKETCMLMMILDTERPQVVLNTTSGMRTRKHTIPVWIKFMKPVFGFNSSLVSISGGYLDRLVVFFFFF